MRKSLMQMYQDLKEANSTSDFPKLLQNSMNKILLEKFKGVNSPWKQYTLTSPLSDFKIAQRIVLGEAPDLIEVPEDGEYKGSSFAEDQYLIQLKTLGRTFTVTRQAIINDDLNALQRQPARFGRAAARTLAKDIVKQLETAGLGYTGAQFFRHSVNLGNTSLTNDAAGIAAVAAAMTSIENSTEPNSGEKMGLQAKFLLVPPDLEDTAMRIVNGQQFVPVSTAGGTTNMGKATRLTVLVDPFLTSATGWYVFADPSDCPAIEVAFLNGKDTPDLLLKKPDTVSVAGGDDPWGYEFDDLNFKVRYDWGLTRAMFQGVYKGRN